MELFECLQHKVHDPVSATSNSSPSSPQISSVKYLWCHQLLMPHQVKRVKRAHAGWPPGDVLPVSLPRQPGDRLHLCRPVTLLVGYHVLELANQKSGAQNKRRKPEEFPLFGSARAVTLLLVPCSCLWWQVEDSRWAGAPFTFYSHLVPFCLTTLGLLLYRFWWRHFPDVSTCSRDSRRNRDSIIREKNEKEKVGHTCQACRCSSEIWNRRMQTAKRWDRTERAKCWRKNSERAFSISNWRSTREEKTSSQRSIV